MSRGSVTAPVPTIASDAAKVMIDDIGAWLVSRSSKSLVNHAVATGIMPLSSVARTQPTSCQAAARAASAMTARTAAMVVITVRISCLHRSKAFSRPCQVGAWHLGLGDTLADCAEIDSAGPHFE